MESYTNGMQVICLGHTWEVERQIVTALPCHIGYAIFRLSFAYTGARAFLYVFLDCGLSGFAWGVRGSSDRRVLIFGRAWGFGG